MKKFIAVYLENEISCYISIEDIYTLKIKKDKDFNSDNDVFYIVAFEKVSEDYDDCWVLSPQIDSYDQAYLFLSSLIEKING